jgi:hypothetical protein
VAGCFLVASGIGPDGGGVFPEPALVALQRLLPPFRREFSAALSQAFAILHPPSGAGQNRYFFEFHLFFCLNMSSC